MELKMLSFIFFEPSRVKYRLFSDGQSFRIADSTSAVTDGPLPDCQTTVEPGSYIHFKAGALYVVVCHGYMESAEFAGWCVVYHRSGDPTYWARPVEAFLEMTVNQSGQQVQRFRLLPNKS